MPRSGAGDRLRLVNVSWIAAVTPVLPPEVIQSQSCILASLISEREGYLIVYLTLLLSRILMDNVNHVIGRAISKPRPQFYAT